MLIAGFEMPAGWHAQEAGRSEWRRRPHGASWLTWTWQYTAGHFPQIYAGLQGHGAEGVVLKRRRAPYTKHNRSGVESRDWLKRRFVWD